MPMSSALAPEPNVLDRENGNAVVILLPGMAVACAETARHILKARSKRKDFFGDIFSDPAWDILLEIFEATVDHDPLSISAVGRISDLPQTTVLRWLNSLVDENLIQRSPDPFDRRRSFVRMSDKGTLLMVQFLQKFQMAIL